MAKKWTAKAVDDLYEIVGNGNIEEVKSFIEGLGVDSLPKVARKDGAFSVYEGKLNFSRLWYELALAHDVEVYRYLMDLGMRLPRNFPNTYWDNEDGLFRAIKETCITPSTSPAHISKDDAERITRYLEALLDDGYKPRIHRGQAHRGELDLPRDLPEVLMALPLDAGLFQRLEEAGFVKLDEQEREFLKQAVKYGRTDMIGRLTDEGRLSGAVRIAEYANLKALEKLRSVGVELVNVDAGCSEDVLLKCAEWGVPPRDERELCETLNARVIEAFLSAGLLASPDLTPALNAGRQDIVDLYERYGFVEADPTERLIEPIEYCLWRAQHDALPLGREQMYSAVNAFVVDGKRAFDEYDPAILVEETRKGAGANWRRVLKRLLALYSTRPIPHCVGGVDWLSAIGSVADAAGDVSGIKFAVPLKDGEIRSAEIKYDVRGLNHCRTYWVDCDADVYRLLHDKGIALKIEATPEAVFLYSPPDVCDYLFELQGWDRKEMKLTPARTTDALLVCENTYALLWLAENNPAALDAGKLKKRHDNRIRLANESDETREFYETVNLVAAQLKKAKKAGGKKAAAPKKSLARQIEDAVDALNRGDESLLVGLMPRAGKASASARVKLLEAAAEHASPETFKGLLENAAPDETSLSVLFWKAASSGGEEQALALFDAGAQLSAFLLPGNKMYWPLADYNHGEDDTVWRVVERIIDKRVDALCERLTSTEILGLAAYAAHCNRPDALSSLLQALERELREEGAWTSWDEYTGEAEVEFRKGKLKYFYGIPDLILPGITAPVAEILCSLVPDKVADRWSKDFISDYREGDTETSAHRDPRTLAILVPYLDGSRVKEKPSLVVALAQLSDLATLELVSEWDGAFTKASIKKALDAASESGSTETVAWLMEKLAKL